MKKTVSFFGDSADRAFESFLNGGENIIIKNHKGEDELINLDKLKEVSKINKNKKKKKK